MYLRHLGNYFEKLTHVRYLAVVFSAALIKKKDLKKKKKKTGLRLKAENKCSEENRLRRLTPLHLSTTGENSKYAQDLTDQILTP